MRLHVVDTGLMLVIALTLTGCAQTAAQSKVKVVNAVDSSAGAYVGDTSALAGAGRETGHDKRRGSRQRAVSAAAVGLGGPLAVKSGRAYMGKTSARVLLRPGGSPGSRLGGDAMFVLTSKTHDLTVTIQLTGLVPGVQYHSALTDASGRVLCDLGPVVPTRGQPGRGSSVTLIHNVTAIQPTWSVVVDQGYR